MNILEEFWYGNIEPAEYDSSSSKEYKELLQLISRNEDKLLATMTEDQKELFTKYADCVREYQVMAECLLFQNSFRLGGRMMLEVMRGGMCNAMVSDYESDGDKYTMTFGNVSDEQPFFTAVIYFKDETSMQNCRETCKSLTEDMQAALSPSSFIRKKNNF